MFLVECCKDLLRPTLSILHFQALTIQIVDDKIICKSLTFKFEWL